MLKNFFALIFLTCGLSSFTWAGPHLIVSDVDDTIRAMNSKNLGEMSRRLNDKENAFSGISSLFKAWKANNAIREVGYVTAGPSMFRSQYEDFLRHNQFPQDFLFMRGVFSGSTYPYKIATIRKIIREQNPDRVFLVGDNSSEDTNVYKAIVDENPHLTIRTFIHQLYSGTDAAPLQSGQTPFLTAADLGILLRNDGEISANDLRGVFSAVATDLGDGGRAQNVVDSFFNCTDFLAGAGWPALATPDVELAQMSETIHEKVVQRCQGSSSSRKPKLFRKLKDLHRVF